MQAPGLPQWPTGGEDGLPPPAEPVSAAPGPLIMGRAADAVLAAVAHAAILFGLFGIGFLLSLAINGGIWLYSRRSPYVAYHARQAGCYQCFVLVFNVVYLAGLLVVLGFYLAYPQWTWVGALALVGILAGLLWFVASILYGVWAAVRVLLGKPFAYPVFGRLAARK